MKHALTPAKMTVQEKIADLERRVMALEQQQRVSVSYTKVTKNTDPAIDLEPEMGNVWKSFSALFDKAFKGFILALCMATWLTIWQDRARGGAVGGTFG